MGKGRLELPRLAAHDPKSCLSASSSTSPRTLKFYHRCLTRFIGHELASEHITEFLHGLDCGNAR
jgi:hypothetical protein